MIRSQVTLVGHGKDQEECLEAIRRKARQYFGVDDDTRLRLHDEDAVEWTSNYVAQDTFMFEVSCQVTLLDERR